MIYMAVLLLVVALLCFVLKLFNVSLGSADLDALGNIFFIASFLVGPVTSYTRRGN